VQPGGLKAALAAARGGETLILHKGVYRGTFRPRSGQPGKPIVLLGDGDGEAVLDGQGASNVLNAGGLHDLMFQRLTFQNAGLVREPYPGGNSAWECRECSSPQTRPGGPKGFGRGPQPTERRPPNTEPRRGGR